MAIGVVVLPMVRTEETGLLRQKTQVRGRCCSSRAVVAREMVCSALGGEPRGDRENPRQQRFIIKYDGFRPGVLLNFMEFRRRSRRRALQQQREDRSVTML